MTCAIMAFLGKPSPADEARAAAYRDWLVRRNPFAIASLVLGIISLVEFGALLVFGVAGIVLGVVALRQLKGAGEIPCPPQELPPEAIGCAPPRDRGHRLAITGIVLSAVSLVIAAWLYSQRPATPPATQPTTRAVS